MFDELDKQNSQNTIPPTPPSAYSGQAFVKEEAKVPADQAAPVVAALNPSATLGAGPSAPVKTEDIFAKVDKVPRPAALLPRPDNPLLPRPTVIPEDDSWLKNKTMILGLALGGLIIVLGGGYLGLKMLMKKSPPADTNTAVQAEVKNIQTAPEASAPIAPETNNLIEPPVEPIITKPIDSDLDGLTDEEEANFGTNANNPDTDQDGLTDREEAKVYGTDPLKVDTDGDGYPDGQEIKNGFNPKGPGKLLDINKQ